ncbi:MAG TPA: acyltransferase, partial [Capillimicrobium sp.]
MSGAAGQLHGRVAQLDGLRAAAVLAVMLQHSGWTGGHGGLYGVDVFFVLSGFLITGVLLGEARSTGRISLRRFYARRWLRLFPALAVMVVVLTPIGPSLSAGQTWESWFGAAAAALTYTSNIVMLVTGELSLGVLDPTWSLAVEEQFYLLWPLALMGLLALRLRLRWTVAIVLGFAAAGLSLFFLAYEPAVGPGSGTAVLGPLFRPDSRFGELLLGCALAMVLAGRAGRAGPLGRTADRVLGAGVIVAIAGLWLAVELHRQAYAGDGSPLAPIP